MFSHILSIIECVVFIMAQGTMLFQKVLIDMTTPSHLEIVTLLIYRACSSTKGQFMYTCQRFQSLRGGGENSEILHDLTGACAHPNWGGLGHSDIANKTFKTEKCILDLGDIAGRNGS